MLYNPVTAFIETTRKLFKSRVRDAQLAYLGDGSGRVEVPDRRGYVYIRFPGGKDANGFATFSTPGIARASGAAFLNFEGAAVYVAIGYNDELEIVSAHYQQLDQSGLDTRVLNPLHQQSKWVYLWQLTIGLATAIATTTTGSLLVSVKKYLHYVNNTFQFFEMDTLSDKVDLAAYVPATDMQCYAAVWVDTYTSTAEVTTSTTQSLFTTLDDSDIQELVAQRPPDAIPHKAFYLANNQGTITQQPASDIDLRQFLNTPAVIGFQSPVAYRERIQPGRQQLFTGSLVVTGSLEVLGSLTGLSDTCCGDAAGTTSFEVTAAEIDFGATAVYEKIFTVTDAAVVGTHLLMVSQSGAAATGKEQDENALDGLILRAVAGTGQFTLYASGVPGPVKGKFKINYLIGAA